MSDNTSTDSQAGAVVSTKKLSATELLAVLKRKKDERSAGVQEKRQKVIDTLAANLPLTPMQSQLTNASQAEKIVSAAEIDSSLLVKQSRVIEQQSSRIYAGDTSYTSRYEISADKVRKCVDEALCINFLPSVPISSTPPEYTYGIFNPDGTFVTNKDQNAPFNAICVSVCLSQVAQLADAAKSGDVGSTKKTGPSFFQTMLKSQEKFNICLATIMVASKAIEGTTNVSANCVLAISGGQRMSEEFVFLIPDGMDIKNKKELIIDYFKHVNIWRMIKKSIGDYTAVDANCSLCEKLTAHHAVIAIGKNKLACQDDNVIPSRGTKMDWGCDWPSMFVVSSLEIIGSVVKVQNVEESAGMKAYKDSLNRTNCVLAEISTMKFSQKPEKSLNIDKICCDLSKFQPNTTLSQLKAFLNDSCVINESTPVLLKESLTQTLTFDSLTFPGRSISSNLRCAYFFLKQGMVRDATYSPTKSLEEQFSNVASSGGTVDPMVVLMGSFRADRLQNCNGFRVNGLLRFFETDIPTAEQSIVYQVDVVNVYLQSILDVKTERISDVDASFLDWAKFLKNKFDVGAKLNVFNFAFDILTAAIVINRPENINNISVKIENPEFLKMEIFHEPNQSEEARAFSVRHLLMVFILTLVYAVDMVYGKAKKLPQSWLAVKFSSRRMNTCPDAIQLTFRDDCDEDLYNSVFSKYPGISPLNMLLILAIINDAPSNDLPLDRKIASLKQEGVESIKTKACNVIDNIYQYKLTSVPRVTLRGKAVPLPEFSDTKDAFADLADPFQGELPDELDFDGEPLVAQASLVRVDE